MVFILVCWSPALVAGEIPGERCLYYLAVKYVWHTWLGRWLEKRLESGIQPNYTRTVKVDLIWYTHHTIYIYIYWYRYIYIIYVYMYNYIIICSPSSHWNFKSWLRSWRNHGSSSPSLMKLTSFVDIPTVHNCHNLPSGYVRIAVENDHWNNGFSH